MSQERFIWFELLGSIGEEAIDLAGCRRFAVVRPGDDIEQCREVYYKTPDEKWIKYVEYFEQFGQPTEQIRPSVFRRQCAPQDVANALLSVPTYGGRLPPELEEYRQYGDPKIFDLWRERTIQALPVIAADHGDTRPIYRGNVLYYKGEVCKEFKKPSSQEDIVDAFSAKGWPRKVHVRMSRRYLAYTVKDMNKWNGSPIRFGQSNGMATWRPRDLGPPKSSESL